jgi:hypothetical protein
MLIRLLRDIYSNSRSDRQQDSEPEGDDLLTCENWQNMLLARMFQLMHNFEQDNFDADRFRGAAPNTFPYESHAAYFLFLLKNIDKFHQARMLLADEASKALYDQLLLFRVLGHLHVRLPFNNPKNRQQVATAQQFRVRGTEDVGMFGPLSIFRVPRDGHDIWIKGWEGNVTWTFLYRQYFFDRDGVQIAPSPGDLVIDAGGCFGDTALNFADVVGESGHVYVFDPLPKHCAIMREAIAMNPSLTPRITVLPAGLSDLVNDAEELPQDNVINPGARIVMDQMPTTTIDESDIIFRDSTSSRWISRVASSAHSRAGNRRSGNGGQSLPSLCITGQRIFSRFHYGSTASALAIDCFSIISPFIVKRPCSMHVCRRITPLCGSVGGVSLWGARRAV